MVEAVLNEMISYFGNDVRRINHALKVFGFAKAIISKELGTTDRDYASGTGLIIETAALLHDIGIKEAERKYNSSAGKYQELEGPAIAAGILEKCGIEKDVIERVCYLVGNHHTYGKIDGTDFQVLVEADFLVNAYEDEMDNAALKAVYEKYIKTQTGRSIFRSVYLPEMPEY